MTAQPLRRSTPDIDTTSWITLRWTRGTRYYRVHLEQDLWANWIVTQVNGRRGSPLGRARAKTRYLDRAGSRRTGPHRDATTTTRLRIHALISTHTGAKTIQSIDDTLTLLRRQSELEAAMKQPGGIRITEEQELHTIRRQLERFPEAVEAIVQAAHALRKPVTNINSMDIEAWARHDKVA